jgi:hypothetical protein
MVRKEICILNGRMCSPMVVNILVNVVLDMCLLELDCIVTVPGEWICVCLLGLCP